MHPINRLSWVPSAAYLYTFWLDRVLLAWEYLRRNPDYRREFCCETALRQQRSAACWVLKCGRTRTRTRGRWTRSVSSPPPRRYSRPERAGGKEPTFDVWKIPGRKTLHADEDHLCLPTRVIPCLHL